MEGDWGIEHLQMLIEQAAKDPDVEWVGLINSDGVIIAHSEPAKIGLRLLMGEDMSIVKTVIRTGEPFSRKRNLPEDRSILEIWKLFTPFSDQITQAETTFATPASDRNFWTCLIETRSRCLFLGLKMDRYKEIQHQDILLAIFIGAVLFVIGSAGVYFIFVVQNAYLVRRNTG